MKRYAGNQIKPINKRDKITTSLTDVLKNSRINNLLAKGWAIFKVQKANLPQTAAQTNHTSKTVIGVINHTRLKCL